MKKLFLSVVGSIKGFFAAWHKPADGNYVPSKEIVAYSVGGMGVQFIATVSSSLTMSASCLLLGSIYGMKPTSLAIIATVSSLVLLVTQPLKAFLIDHTPAGKGKARFWLLWTSIPSAVLMSVLAYLDEAIGAAQRRLYSCYSQEELAVLDRLQQKMLRNLSSLTKHTHKEVSQS